MNAPNADAWELTGFPGRLNVAAYLTADQLAAQYRVLVDVLLEAQEQSLTGVGRDDLLIAVRERIAAATDPATADRLTDPEVFDLDKRMKALHIRADDDTAGQEIVQALRSSISNIQLWRYDQRPPATPRYEEQDPEALLADLDLRHR